MLVIVTVLATVTVGLLVGVELAVAAVLHPLTRRQPLEAVITARSTSARWLGRAMPPWYAVSAALTLALTALAADPAVTMAAGGAAALLAIGIVMSLLLLVPINSRIASWTPHEHPPAWREMLRRWDRLHLVRVTLLLAALILVAIASAVV